MHPPLSIGSLVIVIAPGSCYDGERGVIAEQAGSVWGVALCRVVGVTDFLPEELSILIPAHSQMKPEPASNSLATSK